MSKTTPGHYLRRDVWSYYGPNKQYGYEFNNTLTKSDVRAAVRVLRQYIIPRINDYHKINPTYCNIRKQWIVSKIDMNVITGWLREWTRDIILIAKHKHDVEECYWGCKNYESSLISELALSSSEIVRLFNKYHY